MIRIVIADDHALIRHGLRQMVSEEPDMQVVGEAETTRDLLDFLRTNACDAVVLDLSMPGGSALEALGDIKKGRPNLPVLVLTIHPEAQYAVRAIKAGAAGYLTKEAAPEELVRAIRKIVRGGRYINPALAEQLASSVTTAPGMAPAGSLSRREHEVLSLIGVGRSVSQIAADLGLSVKTISTYRARILQKMGMRTNAELMHHAIKSRLRARAGD